MIGLGYSVDVERIVSEFVLTYMPCEDPAARGELEKKPARELLHIYFNWKQRTIDPQPREVHVSKVLASNPVAAEPRYRNAVRTLKKNLVTGEDVNPHLSSEVMVGYEAFEEGKEIAEREDYDLMLNAWGIHHLHLSVAMRPHGFVKRTKHVLFAVVRTNDVYLIDILPHGEEYKTVWASKHLIETIIEEWPDAKIARVMPGALGVERTLNEEEILQARNSGWTTSFPYKGKVYMTGTGYSSAGTSVQATRRADSLWGALQVFQETVRDNPTYIEDGIREFHPNGPIPEAPQLCIAFLPNGDYCIGEKISKVAFSLQYR
jgi:hypothetical protein